MTESHSQKVYITGMGVAGGEHASAPCARRGLRGRLEPTAELLARCTAVALAQAGLAAAGRLGSRFGVAAGVTLAAVDSILDLDCAALRFGLSGVRPLAFPNTVLNATAGRLAIIFGITGPNATVASAEGSALDAMIYARDMIRQGRAEGFVAGGGSARSRRVESAAGEEGTSAGLAAMFVIEGEKSACLRGAVPLAEVAGAAMAFLPSGGRKAAIAGTLLENLLHQAHILAADISHVASATTPGGRQAEIEREVIERAFRGPFAPALLRRKKGRELFDTAGSFAASRALFLLARSLARNVLLSAFSSFGHTSFVLLRHPGARQVRERVARVAAAGGD